MNMIRQAQEKDYGDIYSVVKTAFASAAHADGHEQDLVNALRMSEAYIPELSLVCVKDGNIVGHIMWTKACVGDTAVLALAPLSVLPAYQRQGIGQCLIKAGHETAKMLGYAYSVVLGSEQYYPKSGYIPADTYGIFPPFDVPRENFMACPLTDTATAVCGVMKYAKEFGIG